MKKNIRNIAITAAALTLTAATTLTAFAGEQLAKIQDEGVLKVGIEGTYPPFTYHDDDDNWPEPSLRNLGWKQSLRSQHGILC